MSTIAPTNDQKLSFYRAALPAVRLLDREADPALLDSNADAAWRAYGSDLPAAVRCDLVLRNYAMLYPAAFAPGPVFGLAGWYDDDPWGAGFERPNGAELEGLFARRDVVESTAGTLEHAISAWGLDVPTSRSPWIEQLSAATNLVVAGAAAAAAVARAFVSRERLSARTQVLLVSESAAARHLIGLTCALLHQTGVPQLVEVPVEGDAAAWATRQRDRLGIAGARMLVTSADARPREVELAAALADVLGVSERVQVGEA